MRVSENACANNEGVGLCYIMLDPEGISSGIRGAERIGYTVMK